MGRFRGILEYDGTEFHGFQQQAEQRTVQAELETSIGRVSSDTRVVVRAAGRTDSGVHARGQVIAFDLPWHGKSLPPVGYHLEDYNLTTDLYVDTVMAVCQALKLLGTIIEQAFFFVKR